MKTHTTRFLIGLALLGLVACGGDSSPSGPNLSLDAARVNDSGAVGAKSDAPAAISAEEACPAGLETETVNGVTACVHETDFDVQRCVTPEMLEGKSELVLKMGFLNSSTSLLYSKPSMFHSREATCAAIQENPHGPGDTVTGFPIEAGSNGIATWTFPLYDDQCGTYAFLDTVRNGEDILFAPMHYVINTGKDCPRTCADLTPRLEAIDRGFNPRIGKFVVDFTATWNGTGATGVLHKKATGGLTEGSNVSPINRTFRYLPLPYLRGQTARLEVTEGSLTCTASVDVGLGIVLPPT